MSEVFLVKLESDRRGHNFAPPFGILYLASALEKAGFGVKLFHVQATRENLDAIVQEVLRSQPLLVGFSALTGPSLLPTLEASRRIRSQANIPIVWGGLHATMLPEQTLESTSVDYVVIGEGEVRVVELSRALAEGGSSLPDRLAGIEGLAYKWNGSPRVNPPKTYISNLDEYFPAWNYLDIERYLYNGRYFFTEFGSKVAGERIAALVTSRGCPWRCAYCYNQFVNKRTFRAHSAERVVSDVEALKRGHDVSAVVFEDDNFFSDRERALAIITKIDIPWSATIRANYVTRWGREFVKTLSGNRCIELRVGGESGSQEILDKMQKDLTVEDTRRAVQLCQEQKVSVGFNFMIGIPGETWPQMLQTFDLMDELEGMGSGVSAKGVTIYLPWPGTPLYDLAVQMGFQLPQRTEEWGIQYGPRQPFPPYLDRRARFVGHYRVLASRKEMGEVRFPIFVKILIFFAKLRWKRRLFGFPIDYHLPRLVLNSLKRLGLGRLAQGVYG